MTSVYIAPAASCRRSDRLIVVLRITTSKTAPAAGRNTKFESAFAIRYFAVPVPGALLSRLSCHYTANIGLDHERGWKPMNASSCAPHRDTSVVELSVDILSGTPARHGRDAVRDSDA